MDLLYIWLGKAKDKTMSLVFENQGFKFTSEFDINYDNNNKELTISENKNYDSDFYKVKKSYKAPFKVTCIVGENGAGKTCLLEMLLTIYNKIALSHFDKENYDEFFFIFKEEKIIYIYKSLLLKIKINCNLKYEFVNDENLKKLITEVIVILYNNFISEHEFINVNVDETGFFDISTQFFLETDHSYFDYQVYPKLTMNILRAFRLREFKRMVYFNFVGNNKKYIFNQSLFNFLNRQFIISPLNKDTIVLFTYLYELEGYILDISQREYYKNYLNSFLEFTKIKINNDNQSLLWSFIFVLLDKIFIYFFKLMNNISDNKLIYINPLTLKCYFENDISPENFLLLILDEFYCLFSVFFVKPEFNIKTILCDKIKAYISILKTIIKNNGCEIKPNIKIDKHFFDENKKNIIQLLDIYHDLKLILNIENEEFIDFSFSPKFSNGEKNILILLSRFYDLKVNNAVFSNSIQNKNGLMICVDEGEIGFHPQWCKKYVEILVSYLQELFAEYNIPIHLIISTNNPIVLSDILPDDVIYLKNKNSLNAYERPKTAFGSNILDLYSDNFFIQDGLIGSFAKVKINQVIKYIKYHSQNDVNTEENIISKEECEYIIKNIGDKNIKAFLYGLFKDKVGGK